MRIAIFLSTLFAGLAASAQQPHPSIYARPSGSTVTVLPVPPTGATQEEIKAFYQKQNDSLLNKPGAIQRGPGLRILPQDGMPCIVPDPNASIAIPNAFPSPQVPFNARIPNGWQVPATPQVKR